MAKKRKQQKQQRERGRPKRTVSMSLAAAVATALDLAAGPDGEVAQEKAVRIARRLLSAKDRNLLADQMIWKAIKEAMKRGRESASTGGGRQVVLPGILSDLYAAYPLDTEGERTVKPTMKMNRFEFQRARDVRQTSLDADQKMVDKMTQVLRAFEPIWDEDPTLTIEVVYSRYEEMRKAG